jgi:hypothetical protein
MKKSILLFLLLHLSVNSYASWLNCLPCLKNRRTTPTSASTRVETEAESSTQRVVAVIIATRQVFTDPIPTFDQQGIALHSSQISVQAERYHDGQTPMPVTTVSETPSRSQMYPSRSCMLYYVRCYPPIY